MRRAHSPATSAKLRLVIVAIATLCLPPSHAAAQAIDGCAAPVEVQFRVDVRLDVADVTLDRSKSRAELTEFSFHGPQALVLGLMQADLDLQTSATYKQTQAAEGICFWVELVEVVLRYKSMDVFVASEYSENSCAYHAIFRHEQNHVAVARNYLDRFAPRFRAALTSLLIPKPQSPKLVATEEESKSEVERLLQKLLRPVVEDLRRELVGAQADLDTPRSYELVRRQCKNW